MYNIQCLINKMLSVRGGVYDIDGGSTAMGMMYVCMLVVVASGE